MANLDILLSPPKKEGSGSVRAFDAERGQYIGHMLLNPETNPPQLEVHFDAKDLVMQAFPFRGGRATSCFFDDGSAMGLINLAIEQART